MTAFEAAASALRVLRSLAAARPGVTAGGEPLLPLPRALREMAAPDVLPHIVQVSRCSASAQSQSACGASPAHLLSQPASHLASRCC